MIPMNIAHMGFSAKYPENTILSFQKALEAGADGIGIDVRMSRDGELVILHDQELARTTNAAGPRWTATPCTSCWGWTPPGSTRGFLR